jgi:tRNA (cytidine/uridine-2'-O-)-methyltransferase
MRVVLVNPRIPQNTGSIGRLCLATDTALTLVNPLFKVDDKAAKRAGLDYWPSVDLHVTDDWREALPADAPVWLFTAHGETVYFDAEFGPDDVLVFGSEDLGLPQDVLAAFPTARQVRLPMDSPKVRSLNLAQSVAVGLYEARRQLQKRGRMPGENKAVNEWFAQADQEILGGDAAWAEGNAGKGRVCSRRAAGMALKGWLAHAPREAYGRSFMHHLNALADDAAVDAVAIREAAHRLAARKRPEAGFQVPTPEKLTPMDDARLIMAWCREQVAG